MRLRQDFGWSATGEQAFETVSESTAAFAEAASVLLLGNAAERTDCYQWTSLDNLGRMSHWKYPLGLAPWSLGARTRTGSFRQQPANGPSHQAAGAGEATSCPLLSAFPSTLQGLPRSTPVLPLQLLSSISPSPSPAARLNVSQRVPRHTHQLTLRSSSVCLILYIASCRHSRESRKPSPMAAQPRVGSSTGALQRAAVACQSCRMRKIKVTPSRPRSKRL